MAVSRVALIFDSVQRPETTGVYCHRALRPSGRGHAFPARVNWNAFPGRASTFTSISTMACAITCRRSCRPGAWWAIDTHLDFAWCREKAHGFDLVFAAQRDGAEELRREGIASATWLPLACDPEIHGKHDVAKQSGCSLATSRR